MTDVGEAAWGYHANIGWAVIPVRPGDKRPAVSWEEFQVRHPTDEEIERWFGNGSEAGVAVVTGAISRLVVVDVDGTEGERSLVDFKIPRTVAARTGKGRHYYFRHPGRAVRNGVRVLPGVDVRGDGGYVVAPPSVHPNGTRYEWLPSQSPHDVELAPVPEWVLRKLDRGARTPAPAADDAIPAGQRNAVLASLAGTMRRRGMSQAAIAGALSEENRQRCRPPLPGDEVAKIAASIARYEPAEPRPRAPTLAREDVHAVFRRWLHLPDPAVIDVSLATVAAHRHGGDPAWVMLVGAPSGGKTEALQSLRLLPEAYFISSLTAQTFASGLPRKPGRSASLLERLDQDGKSLLVLKDFTSVLTLHHDARQAILAQLREIYDGSYSRDFGNATTVSWEGRLGLIAGVTPAIDSYHAVTAVLGERFLYLRLPPPDRVELTLRSIEQAGKEKEMREELRVAVADFLRSLPDERAPLGRESILEVVRIADFTALARSGVEREAFVTREILSPPSPEIPARLAKALVSLASGLIRIGQSEDAAVEMVHRIGRDCVPPTRRLVLEAVHDLPGAASAEIARAVSLPTKTAERAAEDLNALGLLSKEKPGRDNQWTLTREVPWIRPEKST